MKINFIPASNSHTKLTDRTNKDICKDSGNAFVDHKDPRERHKIQFYSTLMDYDYKDGDELSWEPKNKGKLLFHKQWKLRVDILLRFCDIKNENDGKK